MRSKPTEKQQRNHQD